MKTDYSLFILAQSGNFLAGNSLSLEYRFLNTMNIFDVEASIVSKSLSKAESGYYAQNTKQERQIFKSA